MEIDLWRGQGRDLGESFLDFTDNQQITFQSKSQLKILSDLLSSDLEVENSFNKEQIEEFNKVVKGLGSEGDYILSITY